MLRFAGPLPTTIYVTSNTHEILVCVAKLYPCCLLSQLLRAPSAKVARSVPTGRDGVRNDRSAGRGGRGEHRDAGSGGRGGKGSMQQARRTVGVSGAEAIPGRRIVLGGRGEPVQNRSPTAIASYKSGLESHKGGVREMFMATVDEAEMFKVGR